MRIRCSLILAASLLGCGTESTTPDAGLDVRDAAAPDAGQAAGADAGHLDADPGDAAPTDVHSADALTVDATALDAGASDATSVDTGPSTVCAGRYDRPRVVGNAGDMALTEASGVVASRVHPDVLWLHNDSGGQARLFALGTDASAVGRLTLPGVMVTDVEDIAAAPCPGGAGQCLWIADTGDNDRTRQQVTVFVVPEPAMPAQDNIAARVWSFHFRYPIAAVDSEALLVDSSGETLYLFEKVDAARAQVFRFEGPWQDGATADLERLGTIESPGLSAVRLGRMITAADLHPTGTRVLLRVYTGIFEYRLAAGDPPYRLGGATRISVPISLAERQGEALGYDHAGTGLWSIGEGVMQPLHHYGCR